MKKFPKQIHLPVEIKKNLEKMCVDLGTDSKNYIQDLVVERVKDYVDGRTVENKSKNDENTAE
jgi:hypothetical protein